jgi:metal-responsive CopG/Arc/MetJ family transcriptional regulator
MKKINISINDELLTRIDKFSENNYLSRSGLISLACNQFLVTQEAQSMFRSISLAFNKIAEQGCVDEATQKELEDIMRLCAMLKAE